MKPQPQIDYKNIEIEVLNGSGISGQAKIFANKLEKLGYTKVSTGNYKEIVDRGLLLAPTDFGKEINMVDYIYQKDEKTKIIISK